MSERIQLEVTTYTDEVLNVGIKELYIPAFNGQAGILEDHKPYISLLEAGEMNYTDVSGKKFYYYIRKGIIKVIDNTISIICDSIEEIKLEKKKEIKDKLAELDEQIKSFSSWIKLKRNFEEETNLEDSIGIIKKLDKISERKLKLKQLKKKSKGWIDKLEKQKNKIEASISRLKDFKKIEEFKLKLIENLKERKSLKELRKVLEELEKRINTIERYPKRLEKLECLKQLKKNIKQLQELQSFKKAKKRKIEKILYILYIYRKNGYLAEQEKLNELEKIINEIIREPKDPEQQNSIKFEEIIKELEEQESLKELKDSINKLKEKLGVEINSEKFSILNEQIELIKNQIKSLAELEGIKMLDYEDVIKMLDYEIKNLEAQKKLLEKQIEKKEPKSLMKLKDEIEILKKMSEQKEIITQINLIKVLIEGLEEPETLMQLKKIIKELIRYLSDKKEFKEIDELKELENQILEQIEDQVKIENRKQSKKIKKELIKYLSDKKEFKEVEGFKKFINELKKPKNKIGEQIEGVVELESLREMEKDIEEFKISPDALEKLPYKLERIKEKLRDISDELGVNLEELKLEIILEKQREFEIKQKIIRDIEAKGKPLVVEGVKG